MKRKSDTPETATVLKAFQEAWKLVIKDYDARLINGEHTMQASLYRHLLQKLPRTSGYSVFTEAKLTFEKNRIEGVKSKQMRKIDLLITHQRPDKNIPEVIAAVELKFKPRIFPAKASVQKDLFSLALIRNRRAQEDRVDLTMDRFEGKVRATKFSISLQRKLIFAAFCRADTAAAKSSSDSNSFWESYGPKEEEPAAVQYSPWVGMRSCPIGLGVAFAMTSQVGKTASKFFGPAFEK